MTIRIALGLGAILALGFLASISDAAETREALRIVDRHDHRDFTRVVFDNGLRLIVKEDHSVPVVAVDTNVDVGYFDEPDSISGYAHVCEHMFFNGTPRRPAPEDIAQETKGNGGRLNAGTIYDRTHYYVVLPSRNLRLALDIQADALLHPLFDGDVLEREVAAVIQEGRRKLDNAPAFSAEKAFELAFDKHRMRRWRIGDEVALENLGRQPLVDFYNRHYVAPNLVLAVVGDVDTDDVIKDVSELYAELEERPRPERTGPEEPPQTDFRYRRLEGDIQLAHLQLVFHTPGFPHEEGPGLELLAEVLGGGESSRLYRRLREREQLVHEISASSYGFREVGLFHVRAVLEPQHLQAVREAILEEIASAATNGFSDEEIYRAKSLIESATRFRGQDVLGQAIDLAYYETYGDAGLGERWLEEMVDVGDDDLVRLARSYLEPSNASLLEYVPKPDAEAPSTESPSPEAVADALGAAIDRGKSLSVDGGDAPAFVLYQPERGDAGPGKWTSFRLPSGLRVILHEKRGAPVRTLGLAYRGGRILENAENAGITRLMTRSLKKGAGELNAESLADRLAALGTAFDLTVDEDYFAISMSLLTKHFEEGASLLRLVATAPRFDDAQVETERQGLLADLESIRDQSFGHSFQLFRQSLLSGHPYSLPTYGEAEAIAALTVEDLRRWYLWHFDPSSMALCITGDFEIDEMEQWVLEEFIQLTAAADLVALEPSRSVYVSTAIEAVGSVALEPDVAEKSVVRDRKQTAAVYGFATPPSRDDVHYTLRVIQGFTGGMGGRFFERIRTTEGLAYAVSSFDYARRFGGAFACYMATSPENARKARELLVEEVEKLRAKPPEEEEVRRAIAYLTGSFVIRHQTTSSIAEQYLRLWGRGHPPHDYHLYVKKIEAVTLESVGEAAQRFFDVPRMGGGLLIGG